MESIKPYKQKFDYSYTLGAFPTYELLNCRPDKVREVLVHSSYTDREKLEGLCRAAGVPLKSDDKTIARLSDKENVYVIGIYEKYESRLNPQKNHLMLVNPSNMGNVGTIIRTAAAFDITDIAIISPGVDVHNPKVVRGSMGAIFRMNIQYFENFSEYAATFGYDYPSSVNDISTKELAGVLSKDNLTSDIKTARSCYSFMLDKKSKTLTPDSVPKCGLYTLIFGNEATGLPPEFADFTNPLIIPQSEMVDSLNLTIAAGIGMYLFKSKNVI